MILIIFPICVTLLVFSLHIQQKRRLMKYSESIPRPPGIPIIGNIVSFLTAPRNRRLAEFDKLFKNYGPTFLHWSLHLVMIQTSSVEYAQEVLSSTVHTRKGYFYKMLKSWLCDGLLMSDGGKWTYRRKLLTPAFHYSVLNNFIGIANRNCEVLIKQLEFELNSDGFDICKYLSAVTLDIIGEAAMNVRMNTQIDLSQEYIDTVHSITKIIVDRMANPLKFTDFGYRLSSDYRKEQKYVKMLHEMSSKVIKQRIMERKSYRQDYRRTKITDEYHDIQNHTFLDILLNISEEETENLSFNDIQEEVDTFMFEGHDTVSVSLAWTLFLVGNHPEIQNEIFEELNAVFGTTRRYPSLNDLRELTYLECVFKEAMRLYPPVPLPQRTLQHDLQIGDQFVSAGAEIGIHIYAIHRSPEHFPNPNKFNPANFFTENVQNRHPFAYIPFSAGPRNCIGQKFALIEALIILSHFFQHFEVESLQTVENINPVPDIVLRPENGVQVRVKKRLQSNY